MASIKRLVRRQRRERAKRRYRSLDRQFLPLDKARTKRAKELRLVPELEYRIGGKQSYGEWCHVIGVFQALIGSNVAKPVGNQIVDIGCGTGILAVASTPFVASGGHYTGIDVGAKEIEFDKRHYPAAQFSFVHSKDRNAAYTTEGYVSWNNAPSHARRDANDTGGVGTTAVAAQRATAESPWPVESDSVDLVTALSVWTHFNEQDALYYLADVARILKSGARALISMFLLDDVFDARFQDAPKDLGDLQFTEVCCDSGDWLTPDWTRVPEDVIGLRPRGLDRLLEATGLRLREFHPGSWKQSAGVYFQDVAVLEKPT
jgi:SAM-dependent methyltransferase